MVVCCLLTSIESRSASEPFSFEQINDENLHEFTNRVTEIRDETYTKLFSKLPKKQINLFVFRKIRGDQKKTKLWIDKSKDTLPYFFERVTNFGNKGLHTRFFLMADLGTKYLVSNGECFSEKTKGIVYSDLGKKKLLLDIEEAEAYINKKHKSLNIKFLENTLSLFSGEFKKTLRFNEGLKLRKGLSGTFANLGPVNYICVKDLIEFREKSLSLEALIKERNLQEVLSENPPKNFEEERIWGYWNYHSKREKTIPIFEDPHSKKLVGIYKNYYVYSNIKNLTSCTSKLDRSDFDFFSIPVYDLQNNRCKVRHEVGCKNYYFGWMPCDRKSKYFDFIISNERIVTLDENAELFQKIGGRVLSDKDIVEKDNLHSDYLFRVETKRVVNGELWIQVKIDEYNCNGTAPIPKLRYFWVKAWKNNKPSVSIDASSC